MEIIGIGHDNFVPKNLVSGFYQIDSRPMRNLITAARLKEKLIVATNGKKSRTVIVLSDGYVVLSSIAPKTLAERFSAKDEF